MLLFVLVLVLVGGGGVVVVFALPDQTKNLCLYGVAYVLYGSVGNVH